jgi:hypothetical protein
MLPCARPLRRIVQVCLGFLLTLLPLQVLAANGSAQMEERAQGVFFVCLEPSYGTTILPPGQPCGFQ